MAIDKVTGKAWNDLDGVTGVAKASIAKVAGIDVPSSAPTPFFNVDAQESSSYSGSGWTWTDIAGGNNLTLRNGPVFTNNQSTSGTPSFFTFDGANDYAQDGTSLTGWNSTDSWTFETWFNFTASLSSSGNIYTIYSKSVDNSSAGLTMGFRGSSSYKGILFRFATSLGYTDITPSSDLRSSLNDGNWHQIIFTKNAGSGTTPGFYLDGISRSFGFNGSASSHTLDRNFNNTTTLYISNFRGSTSFEFNGKIGAVRWYGSYFDSTQALSNYNSQKGAYGIT
jgi:hypothetical protein